MVASGNVDSWIYENIFLYPTLQYTCIMGITAFLAVIYWFKYVCVSVNGLLLDW